MPLLRVSLGFASAPDNSLDELAGAVLLKLFGNPLYADPPVTSAALTTAKGEFSSAVAAANLGGPGDTATKNNKREDLIGLLRQLALHVQTKHNNDLAALLSSGFEAVSTNHASSPLETPVIKGIRNGHSRQLLTKVGPIANARGYEQRYALVAPDGSHGPWIDGGIHYDSRGLPMDDLTPGSTYVAQVRAIGGSTGVSDWSDPVSHMSL